MANYKQSDYEALRRRCVELSHQGWHQSAIAQAFGLTQPWVSRTLKKHRLQGNEALAEGKRTGAPARLSTQQLGLLVTELSKGAEAHGFSGAIWTRPRINEVIKKLFGVSYDPSQVGRILKKVGWSRQKPQPRARQQDGQAVAQWRDERLPDLKKS
ncbi:winged helix-turn-helix domain-containing protein [Spirosoma sp. RP8]|uniref:Winged helix-turn-helix domain-containing protein n=1 Tax=Spirosoma liriopis TaxID=2937440 RepID=A0ABT0HVA3_9BACT|nr:winged helix-turn-helix domain-containing protein [Spirosoma liriopis]MCK8496074.1 winged helix-turn-helix domain-containing protein [Spirosoma liriopis]